MCNQSREVYTQCGHVEDFTKTTSACKAGWDADTETCLANNLVFHTVYVDSPPLCPDCFHEKEAKINEIFVEEIEELEAEIEQAELDLRKEDIRYTFGIKKALENVVEVEEECQKHDKETDWLGGKIQQCRDHLEEVFQSRLRRLGRFRNRQGM